MIRDATTNRPQLQKFLDDCRKESKDKLGLKDKLHAPISRIPRYELLLKVSLDYT